MDVITYSLTKDSNKVLSANFKVKEFAVGSGFKGDVVKISNDLVRMLQLIRNCFGKAVSISSGYRTSGDRSGSKHLLGQAADFRMDGVNPRDIVRWIEAEIDPPGLGLYDYDFTTEKKTGFVHIDSRTTGKSRWYQTKADDSDYTPIGSKDITTTYLDKAEKQRTLKQGVTGSDVLELALDLHSLGYLCTLTFDSGMTEAVKAMQRACGLVTDGVFGPNSQAALLELLKSDRV